jgi:hypothetical protein
MWRSLHDRRGVDLTITELKGVFLAFIQSSPVDKRLLPSTKGSYAFLCFEYFQLDGPGWTERHVRSGYCLQLPRRDFLLCFICQEVRQ